MKARPFRFVRSLIIVALPLLASGCTLPTGDSFVYPVDAPELANASTVDNCWESAPWTGAPWLPYPSRATVQVEHTLGVTPRYVGIWLSFVESGDEAAMAAGDLARLLEVDIMTITIRNETSATFFVRIAACR